MLICVTVGFDEVLPLVQARVPIVKLTAYGIDCDISIRNHLNAYKAILIK